MLSRMADGDVRCWARLCRMATMKSSLRHRKQTRAGHRKQTRAGHRRQRREKALLGSSTLNKTEEGRKGGQGGEGKKEGEASFFLGDEARKQLTMARGKPLMIYQHRTQVRNRFRTRGETNKPCFFESSGTTAGDWPELMGRAGMGQDGRGTECEMG